MSSRAQLKIIFYLNLAVVIVLVGYKVYLNFIDRTPGSLQSPHVEQIQRLLQDRQQFRFAVVGNINNSIGIFENKIIPMLNAAGVDFVVSAGNAVSGGGEDKYRALDGTLGHLDMPYLLTFGENEASNFGSFRFYERYGPYFFNFRAGNSLFVFLDSTGETSHSWQLRWLEEELAASEADHTFIFIGHPLYRNSSKSLFSLDERHVESIAFRQGLLSILNRYQVDAVFSSNLPLFSHSEIAGTHHVVTGGAGGFIVNNDTSFYHFVTVEVSGEQFRIEVEELDIGQHRFFKTLEGIWLWVHSLFFVGYLNFLLIVSILVIIAIKLHNMIFVDRDYYPDFDIDPAPYVDRIQHVAMFTNNYLPFIGGVPISIQRLRQGLKSMGKKVLIVAPDYRNKVGDNGSVYRLPNMLEFGDRREFRMANIFHLAVRRRLLEFRPDIIHLHHPVWVGSLGLFWARRFGIPAVYTYHTRLEHYAHFVSLPGPLFRNLISHYLIRRFANKCDGIIVPTYSAEEYLRLIGVKKEIFVQPTGIDFDAMRDVDETDVQQLRDELGIGSEKVLVSVSRLSKEKNLDFMLEAAAELKKRCRVPFRFVIVGDGNERRRLEKRIRTLQLESTVILAGSVKPQDIPRYYNLGDIFLFASKTETQGMVILEAMAAGLPVVAVRSSGIDDVVRDEVNGFKTPENSDKWCARIHDLLTDEDRRAKMAEEAVTFARRYSIPRFAEAINQVYAHVLAARDARRSKARKSA